MSIASEASDRLVRYRWDVRGYDLDITLACGQSFRWRRKPIDGQSAWEGVVGKHWVRLIGNTEGIAAEVVDESADASWLETYLQLNVDHEAIVGSFPQDPQLAEALEACRGLRILRQDPWECLASFICSSTKRVAQIESMVDQMCRRYGDQLKTPAGVLPVYAFPSVQRIAGLSETDLRECKLGFRAPNLLAAARWIVEGRVSLEEIHKLSLADARQQLQMLPGVGPKIADCVLLFAYDFPAAFPVDVWIRRALAQLYFPRARKLNDERLRKFSDTHFGPYGGHAQQYLFHHFRTKRPREGMGGAG